MFVGRERELSQLNKRYHKAGFECIVLYGRRRIGKTALIREFCKDKKTIFFTGLETAARENLVNLSQSIYEAQGGVGPAPVYGDFVAALAAITAMARREKLVVVMDEYPYLAKAYAGISSLLQVQIDHVWKDMDLYLILCGSSMSFMEKQVLGQESPLFGRRTAQLKLEPFTIFETRQYFPQMDKEQLAVLFGITGGIPLYLAQMDETVSLRENITRNFFDPMAYLFEEPSNLLKQELREPANYNAIIQSIAQGATKLSQIAAKVGLEVSACAGYIKNLCGLGIVEKETPLGEKQSKKSIYMLKDGMFRFWYRFVPRHYSLIQNGMGDVVYERISPEIPDFMGQTFERICREWLWQQNRLGNLPLIFDEAGRWWGTDPRLKKQAEIDILAQNAVGQKLFCECKWRNEDLDDDVLATLLQRGGLFPAQQKDYILFTKRNFSQRCQRKAKEMAHVRLVTYDDMI